MVVTLPQHKVISSPRMHEYMIFMRQRQAVWRTDTSMPRGIHYCIRGQVHCPYAPLPLVCTAQVIQVVCCRMTGMQLDIYKQFVQSTTTRRLIADADMGQKKTASRILTVYAPI